jgi:hypothetical protein
MRADIDDDSFAEFITPWSIPNHPKQEFRPTVREETGVSSRGEK